MLKTVDQPHTYFSRWLPRRSKQLRMLETEAESLQIPIIGPVVGRLLYLLVRFGRPQRILELGSACGYSAIFIGEACLHTGGRLLTLEKDAALAAQAGANIAKAGLSECVEVRCTEAKTEMARQGKPFDMIFMDIEKAEYAGMLPDCKRLLTANGMLVADNTGFKDAHGFNLAIFSDPDWEMVNMWSFLPGHSPENDGICMAMKRA